MGDKFNSSFSMNGQNSVIKRINDTSSSMTWREHQHLGWKEASQCDFSNMSFRGVSFAGANLDSAKLDSMQVDSTLIHSTSPAVVRKSCTHAQI